MSNNRVSVPSVGYATIDMIANLWISAGTFKYAKFEKVSFVLLNYFDMALTMLAAHLGLNELNPLVKSLLAAPLQLLIVKCAVPLLSSPGLRQVSSLFPPSLSSCS